MDTAVPDRNLPRGTERDDGVLFTTLEDETGQVDVILWSLLSCLDTATGVTQYAISRQSAISRYLRDTPVTTIHHIRASFMVLTDSHEETDRYWNAVVSNGGEEVPCGWCKDRWGFSWQITPRRLLELVNGPDRDAARRAWKR